MDMVVNYAISSLIIVHQALAIMVVIALQQMGHLLVLALTHMLAPCVKIMSL